jgi:riboflavin kinase/FMN adenylyltransferase
MTIGVFDAIHLGHQAILARGRQLADRAGAPLVVLAFDPHPAALLRPDLQPPRLTTSDEKQVLLKQYGADQVIRIEPSRELFAQSPALFIEQLVKAHHPIAIVEGGDFRFGHQRQGDIHTLRELGTLHGCQTHICDQAQVMLTDQLLVPVSSSLTRWLVGQGRVADAARCLGRLYSLTGPVAKGEARGRTINVPTANLDLTGHPDKLIPADGVYAGLAVLPDGREFAAAISIGVKPTFGEHQLTVEAHLLDFSGDLYGQTLTLQLARWLRDQQSFPDVEALKAQLSRDITRTRQWHEQGLLRDIHITQRG